MTVARNTGAGIASVTTEHKSSSVEIEKTCVTKNLDEAVRLRSEKKRRLDTREAIRDCRGYK